MAPDAIGLPGLRPAKSALDLTRMLLPRADNDLSAAPGISVPEARGFGLLSASKSMSPLKRTDSIDVHPSRVHRLGTGKGLRAEILACRPEADGYSFNDPGERA